MPHDPAPIPDGCHLRLYASCQSNQTPAKPIEKGMATIHPIRNRKSMVWTQNQRFLRLLNILSKKLKKDEKKCWQMKRGVIVYPSARESGKQIVTQTDEVWHELLRKSKNSAQNGAWKFLEKSRKKFLTKVGKCAKINKSQRCGEELYLVNWIT